MTFLDDLTFLFVSGCSAKTKLIGIICYTHKFTFVSLLFFFYVYIVITSDIYILLNDAHDVQIAVHKK